MPILPRPRTHHPQRRQNLRPLPSLAGSSSNNTHAAPYDAGSTQTVAFSHYNNITMQLPLDPGTGRPILGDVAAQTAQFGKQLALEPVNYDEAAFRYAHNADAMATEKLAEGIRAFAADAVKLEQLMLAA